MSRGEVVKTGYLTKSPPERMNKVAQWHRRWFVLSDSHRVYPLAKRYVRMEYYQSEDDTKKMKDPKGVINLQQCTTVANRENLKGYKHVFDLCTVERTYHLAADSSSEKHEWIDTLNRTLFSSSQVPSSHSSSSNPPQMQTAGVIQRMPQDRSSSPSQEVNRGDLRRPLSYAGDSSVVKQHRPLPPVPGESVSNRPLPPTPPDTSQLNQPYTASDTRHYKRPPHQPTPSGLPHQYSLPQSLQHLPDSQHSLYAPPHKHVIVRQTKSHSNVPSSYSLTPGLQSADQRDYVNLDNEAISEEPPPHPKPRGSLRPPVHCPSPHSQSENSSNLNETLPEKPPVPSTRQKRAPPKARSVDYVNLEEPSVLGGEDYSVLKPEPRHACLDQDYSRLELPPERGHGRGTPTGPPPRTKDYENLAYVAHPDDGDYSHLQY